MACSMSAIRCNANLPSTTQVLLCREFLVPLKDTTSTVNCPECCGLSVLPLAEISQYSSFISLLGSVATKTSTATRNHTDLSDPASSHADSTSESLGCQEFTEQTSSPADQRSNDLVRP